MHGPIQWINQFGYRKLNNFEEHAMFIMWRELSVMLGCKWVPQTREEFEKFRVVSPSPNTALFWFCARLLNLQ